MLKKENHINFRISRGDFDLLKKIFLANEADEIPFNSFVLRESPFFRKQKDFLDQYEFQWVGIHGTTRQMQIRALQAKEEIFYPATKLHLEWLFKFDGEQDIYRLFWNIMWCHWSLIRMVLLKNIRIVFKAGDQINTRDWAIFCIAMAIYFEKKVLFELPKGTREPLVKLGWFQIPLADLEKEEIEYQAIISNLKETKFLDYWIRSYPQDWRPEDQSNIVVNRDRFPVVINDLKNFGESVEKFIRDTT